MLMYRIKYGVCAVLLFAASTQNALHYANAANPSSTARQSPAQGVAQIQIRQTQPTLYSSQGALSLSASIAQTPTLIFVPLVMRSYPAQTMFGIETTSIDNAGDLPKLLELGAKFVRRNALNWASVEPTEGARNWSAIAGIDQELKNAAANGLEPILIILGAPDWAKRDASSNCGPVKQSKFAAFATFAHDVAERYKNAPYNLKYIELFNEPDATLNTTETVFGCWGDPDDPYYGGGYYADMLKVAYPKIKEGNPNAKVLNGGLLLDNDGSGCSTGNPNACPGRFFEGILRNGGGDFLDIVSYHAYDFYKGNGTYISNQFPGSNATTGPVVIAKTRFLKKVMSQYGVTGKLLFNTETGLIVFQGTKKTADMEETKARYVPEVYIAGLAEGVSVQSWFSLQGWFLSDLIDPTYPQAFNAYKFMTKEVGDSKFSRTITNFPGVLAYELNRGDRKIWILWSMDNSSKTLALGGTPLAKFDLYGNAGTPAASLTLDGSPVYLEWAP